MNLIEFGHRAYACALRRGKVNGTLCGEDLKAETIKGLQEEVQEVIDASYKEESPHVKGISCVAEELTDVMIVCCTELFRRGYNIEELLQSKMKFNETRED